MEKGKIFFFLLSFLVCSINGQLTRTYNNTVLLNAATDYYLHWNFLGNLIQFGVQANTTGWVGLGFSPDGNMLNSDVIVGYYKAAANPPGQVNDYKVGVTRIQPSLDATQNAVKVNVTEVGPTTFVEFDRLVNTNDTVGDRVIIPAALTFVLWAQFANDPITNTLFFQHDSRGSAQIRFNSAATVPGQVTSVSFPSKTDASAEVQWSPLVSDGGDALLGYRVQVDDGAGGAFTVVYQGTATSFNITGLEPFTTYRVRIQAQNNVGFGTAVNRQVTTNVGLPSPMLPPTLVSFTTASIELQWLPPANNGGLAINYLLEMNSTIAYNGVGTTFNISGLTALTLYNFRIAANNSIGAGTFSSFVAFSTSSSVLSAPDAPAPPTLLTRTSSSITVSWTAPFTGGSPITSYTLRVQNATGTFTVFNGLAFQFTLNGLKRFTGYSFDLAATNAVGISNFSSVAQIFTEVDPPSAPLQPINGTITANSITIQWSAPADNGGAPVLGYIVQADNGQLGSFSNVFNGTGQTFTHSALAAGAYRYRVAAYNLQKTSTFSTIAIFSTDGYLAPIVTTNEFRNVISVLGGVMKIYWKIVNSGTEIWIALEASTTGWVGFGIGNSMTNADMYAGSADAVSATIGDYFSSQNGFAPPADTQNNILQSIGIEFGGVTTIKFRRALVTGDVTFDRPINSNATAIVFAYHRSSDSFDSTQAHEPSDRATTVVNFFAVGPTCLNDCSSHGICLANGTCQCFTGFGSSDCSKVKVCDTAVDCNSNGNCVDGVCNCFPGFSGSRCENTTDILTPDINPDDYTFTASFLDGKITVYWRIDNDVIEIALRGQTTGWVGFGIGTGMTDADIYLGYVDDGNGDVVLSDYRSVAEETPTQDTALGGTNNILAFNGMQDNGETILKFRRLLVTGDSLDKDITDSDMDVIVALNLNTDNLGSAHGSANRVASIINFFNGNNQEGDEATFIIAHAVLMTFGWGFFMYIGMFIARFVKALSNKWFWIHIIVNAIGLACVGAGFGIAIYMVDDDFAQPEKLPLAHAWLGLVTVALGYLQLFTGTTADRVWRWKFSKNKSRGMNDAEAAKIKTGGADYLHHWAGRIAILISAVVIFIGFAIYDLPYWTYIIFGVWIFILIIAFIIMQIKVGAGHKEDDAPKELELAAKH